MINRFCNWDLLLFPFILFVCFFFEQNIICLLVVSDLSSCITIYILQNNAMHYIVHRLIFYDSNQDFLWKTELIFWCYLSDREFYLLNWKKFFILVCAIFCFKCIFIKMYHTFLVNHKFGRLFLFHDRGWENGECDSVSCIHLSFLSMFHLNL